MYNTSPSGRVGSASRAIALVTLLILCVLLPSVVLMAILCKLAKRISEILNIRSCSLVPGENRWSLQNNLQWFLYKKKYVKWVLRRFNIPMTVPYFRGRDPINTHIYLILLFHPPTPPHTTPPPQNPCIP